MKTIKTLGISLFNSTIVYVIISFTTLEINPIEWGGLIRFIFALCVLGIFLYDLTEPERERKKDEEERRMNMYINYQKELIDEF